MFLNVHWNHYVDLFYRFDELIEGGSGSWWWVFAPLWIYALASLMAGFIVGYRAVRKAHLRQKEMLDKAPGRSIPQSKH